jgi:hypothetical protein
MSEAFSLLSAEALANLEELAARVERAAAPSGPKVLIVPGLSGSRLGRPPRDAIWFDLLAIREGRFPDLAEGREGIAQLGVFEELYLRMMLHLRLAGYEVGLFPYDWRCPVPEVGAELSARIRAEDREVHLVTHSFGALVARAAAVAGTPNLGKVVMLGPTNHGVCDMVQALRGTHWALHFVSVIDNRRSAYALAEQVVSTWRSIPMGLPVKLHPDDLDLFDLASWPAEGLRPDAELLRDAAEFRQEVASSTGSFFVVAGYGQPTVARVERDGGRFRYHLSNEGDGFVTPARAALDGHPVYYVRAAHIGMPNHPAVIDAVRDLLDRGATERLERALPPFQPGPSFSDDDPVEPPFGGRRGEEITPSDLRALWDQVLGFVLPTVG